MHGTAYQWEEHANACMYCLNETKPVAAVAGSAGVSNRHLQGLRDWNVKAAVAGGWACSERSPLITAQAENYRKTTAYCRALCIPQWDRSAEPQAGGVTGRGKFAFLTSQRAMASMAQVADRFPMYSLAPNAHQGTHNPRKRSSD